ncbi:MAG: hypothetical protein ACLP0A_17025, partial [Verrucomicrobiia bacterium]
GVETCRADCAREVATARLEARRLLDRAELIALDFFMNSLNWLLQREQLVAVSPKTPEEFRLDMSPHQQMAVYILVMGGMPLAVAIAGLLVWLGRRK